MSAPAQAFTEMQRTGLRALLRTASIEVSPRDSAGADILRKALPPGTDVFVNVIAGRPCAKSLAMCTHLRRAGFNPVPHLAARGFAGRIALDEFLARAAGEAGVDTVLVIGGDLGTPLGPYESGAALLRSGALSAHGMKRVGLPGYPEGHPGIPETALRQALHEKLGIAREQGLEAMIVTQFCFEAAPIRRWIAALRGTGVAAPVRIGIAGPANLATLAKYALKCGIGTSLHVLRTQSERMIHLMGEAAPDSVVRDLAAEPLDALGAIAGVHLFPFGGTLLSAHWLRTMLASV